MNGKNLNQWVPLPQSLIILGNESKGIDLDKLSGIESVITIGGNKSLGADSLNVAISTGIIAHWINEKGGNH